MHLVLAFFFLPTPPVVYPLVEVTGTHDDVVWVAFEPEFRYYGAQDDWTQRGPNVRTAPAAALPQPRTFTLVGSGPPCIVTTATTVSIFARWGGQHRAFEVPRSSCGGAYVMAVEGIDRDARAVRASGKPVASVAITTWTERELGIRLPENGLGSAAYLDQIPGSDIDAVYAFISMDAPRRSCGAAGQGIVCTGAETALILRRSGRLLARFGDNVLVNLVGSLSWRGEDLVVVSDGRQPWAHFVGH